MKIDFKELGTRAEFNFKGGTGIYQYQRYEDEDCKIMIGTLTCGSSIGLHSHDGSLEAIYIIKGQGKMICNCEEEILNPGDSSYCGDGASHTLRNDGIEDLVFFSVIANLKK